LVAGVLVCALPAQAYEPINYTDIGVLGCMDLDLSFWFAPPPPPVLEVEAEVESCDFDSNDDGDECYDYRQEQATAARALPNDRDPFRSLTCSNSDPDCRPLPSKDSLPETTSSGAVAAVASRSHWMSRDSQNDWPDLSADRLRGIRRRVERPPTQSL
jgi:hypothetical protein